MPLTTKIIPHSRPWITNDDREKIRSLFNNDMIGRGEKVDEFEVNLKQFLKSQHLMSCSCGTNALILALLGLGVKNGDEVILPTYVCKDVLRAVQFCRAKPVLCDIGPEWNVTPETVSEKITSLTKAIILVHLYGIPINTYQFLDFGIPIIEDCCQAFGASIKNKKIGTLGTVGIFSFHATKCLTCGEGGAIACEDNSLWKRIGKINSNSNIFSRMTDIQAVLGNNQLNRYSTFLESRQKISTTYLKELPSGLTEKMRDQKSHSIFFRFLLNTKNDIPFTKIKRIYQLKGIAVRRGVDQLLHRIYLKSPDSRYPCACSCFDTTLSIPIYPSLSIDEIRKIIEVTTDINEKRILK